MGANENLEAKLAPTNQLSNNKDSEISIQGEHENEDPTSPKATQYSTIIFVGVIFLLLFTAMSASSLFIQVLDQLGFGPLGPLVQLLHSVLYIVGIFLVPAILKKWNYRNAMFFSAIGYVSTLVTGSMNVACGHNNELPWCEPRPLLYGINVIASLLYGVAGPLIWTSAFKYLMGITRVQDKGKVMGIFMGMMNGAVVIGNLIPYFFLKSLGEMTYFTGCSLFGCLVVLSFLFIRHVPKAQKEEKEEVAKAAEILKLAWTPRMRPMIPIMFYLGFMDAAVSAFQYKVVTATDPKLDELGKTALMTRVLVIKGFIQVLASLVAGKGADKYSRKIVLYVFHTSQGIAIIATLFCYLQKSMFLAYIMAFFWSFGTAGVKVLMSVFIEKDFDGDVKAYALPQFLALIGVSCCLIASIVLADSIIGYIGALAVVFVVSQLGVSTYKIKTK